MKEELAKELIQQTKVAYEIQFMPESENNIYMVGWSNEKGLYGDYPEDMDIENEIKIATIIEIKIK